jgi:hypothetical protein
MGEIYYLGRPELDLLHKDSFNNMKKICKKFDFCHFLMG